MDQTKNQIKLCKFYLKSAQDIADRYQTLDKEFSELNDNVSKELLLCANYDHFYQLQLAINKKLDELRIHFCKNEGL